MTIEPFHHPLASQRVKGEGGLRVVLRGARTRLAELHQAGAAKIRLPASTGAGSEAILINTAGGMTAGDQLRWTLDLGPGASLVATTQACEKMYRAIGGRASVSVRIGLGEGARLAWLPQETIFYHGSALRRRIDVDLAEGATALIVEASIFGRRAMGETVRQVDWRDTWRVTRNEVPIHAENVALRGDAAEILSHPAVAEGATAMATILYVAPEAADRLDAARAIVGDAGGVSAWSVAAGGSGKLLARLVASDGYSLRRRLVPLLELLNERAALPKVWSL